MTALASHKGNQPVHRRDGSDAQKEKEAMTETNKLKRIPLKGLCRRFRSDQHFVGNGFGYKADGE
jgi:hypothetical protein